MTFAEFLEVRLPRALPKPTTHIIDCFHLDEDIKRLEWKL
jgi:hypothetical protein